MVLELVLLQYHSYLTLRRQHTTSKLSSNLKFKMLIVLICRNSSGELKLHRFKHVLQNKILSWLNW